MKPLSSQLLLQRWYGTLALLACAASLQALLLPRWPRADELASASIVSALRKNGFQPEVKDGVPASRTYELARSKLTRLHLNSGDELNIVNTTTRERLKFDLNNITNELPQLRLEKSQSPPEEPFSSIGTIQGRVARQTCLVTGPKGNSRFGVQQEQLFEAIDTLSQERASRNFLHLLGGGSSRSYRCVLITMISAPGKHLPKERWDHLLMILQPILQKQDEVSSSAESISSIPGESSLRLRSNRWYLRNSL